MARPQVADGGDVLQFWRIAAMGRACSTNGEKRNAYRILVGKEKVRDHWEDQGVGG
jgi:hypothetical protein